MNRLTLPCTLLILATILAGCGMPYRTASQSRWWHEGIPDYTQTPTDDEIMQVWIGTSANVLMDSWGQPERWSANRGGYEVIEYRDYPDPNDRYAPGLYKAWRFYAKPSNREIVRYEVGWVRPGDDW